MEERSTEALSTLRINIPSVRNRVGQLSGGQRQSVAVAKAVLWSPKIVILDEPTAALGVAQTRQVLDLVLRLKERGLAVVVITHNVVDVFEVAARSIVLRLGRRVATLRIGEVTRIPSRTGDRVQFIELSRVTHFFAEDKLTYAATKSRNYVIDSTISQLEEKLDPRQFCRIHRSTLVNLAYVGEADSLSVRLKDEKGTALPVARDRLRNLRQRLGY